MMVVVGISHHTAPIEVREQAALPPNAVEEVLTYLQAQNEVGEAFIVSTCNRVEIMAAPREQGDDPARLEQAMRTVEGALVMRAPGVRDHLYRRSGTDAVRHLFRVAASLDSLVLGEPQILGQVKAAFDLARKQGTVGGQLHRAMNHALRAAKRVRSETTVGAGQVSVPSVAVDLARQIFGELKGHKAALLGSGQMGETVAKLLVGEGVTLQVVGRNQTRVAELASQFGAAATSMDRLADVLTEVDVFVTTTSASHYVVTAEAVKAARKKRRGRSLFLIDLAVPRDVDPNVNKLDGVFLYNVDDLSQIVAQTLSSRQKEASRAEAIVAEEVQTFERGVNAQQVTPVVVALRRRFDDIINAELERSLKTKLKHLPEADREALSRMVEASVNKLLHAPTRHLRTLAADSERGFELDTSVGLVADLFELQHSEGSLAPVRIGSPATSEGVDALNSPGQATRDPAYGEMDTVVRVG
jgi:glutamyl-tRNA reductase